MLATFYLFLICSAILMIVSRPKPHRHTAESEALVWKSPLAAISGPIGKGRLDYRIVAAILFAGMIVLYVIFA
jgi:SSS family solute:Na+ symporter